jgi:hypothetical protein
MRRPCISSSQTLSTVPALPSVRITALPTLGSLELAEDRACALLHGWHDGVPQIGRIVRRWLVFERRGSRDERAAKICRLPGRAASYSRPASWSSDAILPRSDSADGTASMWNGYCEGLVETNDAASVQIGHQKAGMSQTEPWHFLGGLSAANGAHGQGGGHGTRRHRPSPLLHDPPRRRTRGATIREAHSVKPRRRKAANHEDLPHDKGTGWRALIKR